MADDKYEMETLHVMLNDDFKVGDYVYIVRERGHAKDGKSNPFIKKKLSIQDLINLKLGIPFNRVCPNHLSKATYKITKITEYEYETLSCNY